jgi:hypothetical protein
MLPWSARLAPIGVLSDDGRRLMTNPDRPFTVTKGAPLYLVGQPATIVGHIERVWIDDPAARPADAGGDEQPCPPALWAGGTLLDEHEHLAGAMRDGKLRPELELQSEPRPLDGDEFHLIVAEFHGGHIIGVAVVDASMSPPVFDGVRFELEPA